MSENTAAARRPGVENNLSISNMAWEDFASGVSDDGVFRGFEPPPPNPDGEG